MKKTIREWMQDRRVAAALAGLAVILVAYRFFPAGVETVPPATAPPGKVAGPTTPVPSEGQSGTMAAPGTPAAPARAAGEIPWSWSRNPFIPQWREGGAGETAAGAGFQPVMEVPAVLRGTVISGDLGVAIFGSRLVPLGGTVGDWRLERVVPYGVTLRRGNEVRVMELFKPAPSGGRGRGGDR